MSYHPFPNTNLLSLTDVQYEIQYRNDFIHPNNPDIDGSHIHDCYEVYLNITGDVSFLVENKIYHIRRGDAVITRPSEIHRCIYHSPCYHEHFCLWFQVSEKSPLVSFMNRSDFCHLFTGESSIKSITEELFVHLYKCKNTSGCELEQTTYFLQVLFNFSQWITPTNMLPKTGIPKDLQRILDYINLHFREIQHIKEIYELFFVSASTLNRWFQEYVHFSPREYLESKKLSAAQQLLIHGCSVTEACMQSGFSDSSHFIAVFRKKFGETPYRYKINHAVRIQDN